VGKYRKILVAFDGSASSRNALKQAIKFQETEKAWIRVLVVLPPYEGDLEIIGVSDIKSVLEGSSEKLMKEAKEIAESERAAIITNVEQGQAYEKIVDVADAENCDIIVMGRRGIHHIERMLMGSVTSRVIGYTKKDVLVVPRDARIQWGNILLTVDNSNSSETAVKHALDFAASYGARVTVLSVVDVNDEFYAQVPHAVDQMVDKAKSLLEEVRKSAEALDIETETFVREGESYEKILETASEKNADMIFMGSHGRRGVKKLVMGSVTERVIGFSTCPVMVVKP
jgi:nucleotide-binding universal stress UspA family protein